MNIFLVFCNLLVKSVLASDFIVLSDFKSAQKKRKNIIFFNTDRKSLRSYEVWKIIGIQGRALFSAFRRPVQRIEGTIAIRKKASAKFSNICLLLNLKYRKHFRYSFWQPSISVVGQPYLKAWVKCGIYVTREGGKKIPKVGWKISYYLVWTTRLKIMMREYCYCFVSASFSNVLLITTL